MVFSGRFHYVLALKFVILQKCVIFTYFNGKLLSKSHFKSQQVLLR